MKFRLWIGMVLCALAAHASAAPIVNVGNHGLQPNLAGQTIQLFVSGTDFVSGMDGIFVVADTGPVSEGGSGSIDGPNITGIDLLTGTIFAGGSTFGGQVAPQWWTRSANVNDPVLADGLIATVTLSTVGFNSGTWDLKMRDGPFNSHTDWDGNGIINGTGEGITNGTIFIVPEPAGMIAGFAALTLALRRRRVRV